MPRSGGGGSHSGGSHRSSGGSRSFSRSSGGGSRSFGGSHSGGYRSVSGGSRSFGSSGGRSFGSSGAGRSFGSPSGGPRRRYTSRGRQTQYARSGGGSGCSGIVLVVFIIFALLFAGLKNTFSLPKKTEHKNVGQPVIQDTIGILGNTSALSDSLTAFQRKTGIVPAVVTVNDENWNGTYSSLEAAAFDVYAELFRDELHWLIVYSEPSLPDPAFIDWSWESIVGDDTGDVLTDSLLNSFGTRLQHDLSSDQYSTAEALIRAFDAVTATVRETGGGSSVGILPVVVLIAVIVLLFLRRSRKKDAEAPADNEAAANDTAASETAAAEPVSPAGREEHVCAYCGSVLPADAVKCPCCGAARKKG